MASPDSTKKIQVRLPIEDRDWLFVKNATDQANTTITTVRIAVAVLESMSLTPTFASTAVMPAKNADSSAQINQFKFHQYLPAAHESIPSNFQGAR